MNSRCSLSDDLRTVPESASFAILLRHAEREVLADGDLGDTCPLTPKGLCDAREFGAHIADTRIDRVYSSPVLRCVDTARAIIDGAGISRTDVVVRDKLGDPGIYINNFQLAALAFKKYGNTGVVEQYLKRGGLEGFATSCGRRLIMSDICRDLAQAGSHNIYVSHDLLLIPLITHMTGEKFSTKQWLDYLDGFIITILNGDIRAIRKGKAYPVSME